MQKLIVDLEHCYGVKRFKMELDFRTCKACAIYAPNGSMKSSLAKVFKDIAAKSPSRDRIFPQRVTKRIVKDEAGADIPPESVLVVEPYDEVMGHSEKTSTLLVNDALRKEMEKLFEGIDQAKGSLLKALKSTAGTKRDIEKEIATAFTSDETKFMRALERVRTDVNEEPGDAPFATIFYDTVFDEKVLAILETKDFKSKIKGYIEKYNELIAASTYFKKGVFNYYNASTVADQLAKNGFFDAKHSINFNAESKVELSTLAELEKLIADEKAKITSDKELTKEYAALEKLLEKNVTAREFHAYLTEHEELLVRLENIESLRMDVLISYLKVNVDAYNDLLEKNDAAKSKLAELTAQADKERTLWEDVIDLFNDRFFVPFRLTAANKVDVSLGREPILKLGFTFKDDNGSTSINKPELLQALSTGERKAFYVLNVLFEIEVRKKAGLHTLLVVDDIADSFDYKNKYAIVQYLTEIATYGIFNQLILTHNFDFYRTINSRGLVSYSNCFMASKTSTEVCLRKAEGIRNVFVKDWKEHFFDDDGKRIASIPFMRNLIEFTAGDQSADYVALTSLLHWKFDSASMTQGALDDIYGRLFGGDTASANPAASAVDMIVKHAQVCVGAPEGANFENKIVLSIAIRLIAERFMIAAINDPPWVAGIVENQTSKLLARYVESFPAQAAPIRVLRKVLLMTPENIHLNSFMYEPILDMSDDHLRRLYGETLALI
jgi:hypothetical protein